MHKKSNQKHWQGKVEEVKMMIGGRNGTIYSYLFLWWQGNSWKEFSLPLVTCIKWKYKENQEQKMVHCQHCHRVWTVWVKKAKIKKYTVAHFQCNPRETILIAFETRCSYFYNITTIRIQLVIIYFILDVVRVWILGN